MDITTPRKNIKESDNKSFGISCLAGSLFYGIENEKIETGWEIVHEIGQYNIGLDTTFIAYQNDDFGFYNPTDDNPMRASLFLSYHIIPEHVRQILYSKYKNLKHYHKDIEAMLKTLVYQRIRRIRYYPRIEHHLKDYDHDAELLGFVKNGNNGRHIPDKKTLGHFENIRLGFKGLGEVRDAYVVALKNELKKYGYTLGEEVSIDSTPLTALSKDPEARYNVHYEKFMYKVHIVVDVKTNIPLVVMITSGTDFDGNFLVPILEKLESLGIHPMVVYADEHYDTMENWAAASLEYGVKLEINLAKNAQFREDGILENLQKEYQKLHDNADFKPQDKIHFREMLRYLVDHGKYKCVGAYFRNKWCIEWDVQKTESKSSGGQQKKPRSKSEGLHGHLKENMMFDVFMDGRGMRYAKRHVNVIIISLLVVALTRVQHGVLNGLTRIACLT